MQIRQAAGRPLVCLVDFWKPETLSLHPRVPAAVDVEGLAGDVAGLGAGQEEDGVGNFVRLAKTVEGDLGEHLGADFVRDGFAHFGEDDAGGNGVDGDALAAQLPGEDAGHGADAGLGSGVVSLAEKAQGCGDAGQGDDAAVVAHALGGCFATVEDAGEVGVDDGLPFIDGHFLDGFVTENACVVDEDVDTAKLLDGLVEHGVDLVEFADIAREREGA